MDAVEGTEIYSGLPSERSVSSDHQLLETGHGLGQGAPVGMSCLSPHGLDRPQTCWWLLLWARREAGQQGGRIPASGLGGSGFSSVAEELRPTTSFPSADVCL